MLQTVQGGKWMVERRDVTDRARWKGVVGERRDVTDRARGKVVGGERRDVRLCKGEMGLSGET